ncbi:MAG: PD-(D/E)XK nuclease family protein [Geoalkalibacter sp.]|uniref:PD-(D/E)XK nuclease family protein n=1 Tax=Geoalkalibacter sp. TaxID=3041440 RepID=UPI003D12173E
MSVCHFILAEDRAQSRYLKRHLAEKGAWLNVVVGTWVELLTTLENLFLVEAPTSDWSAALAVLEQCLGPSGSTEEHRSRARELIQELQAAVNAGEALPWDDLPIHGLTDTLVALPGGRIYVVDFKKSKSDKRRERMTKGYDSQATLYRIMLQTGEAHKTEDDLARAFEQGAQIGVLYYLMNDQVVLADTAGWLPQDLAGADELGDGISTRAMTLIRERLAQIRRGEVRLNHEDDERWYDKEAGMAIYALDNSPLLRLFMHRGEVAR